MASSADRLTTDTRYQFVIGTAPWESGERVPEIHPYGKRYLRKFVGLFHALFFGDIIGAQALLRGLAFFCCSLR